MTSSKLHNLYYLPFSHQDHGEDNGSAVRMGHNSCATLACQDAENGVEGRNMEPEVAPSLGNGQCSFSLS